MILNVLISEGYDRLFKEMQHMYNFRSLFMQNNASSVSKE